MRRSAGKKLRLITITYWLLLVYIIAALVWWFITLENQNAAMKDLRLAATERQSEEQVAKIYNEYKRNTNKYIAEGVTFLILILIGISISLFSTHRSVRKYLRMKLDDLY